MDNNSFNFFLGITVFIFVLSIWCIGIFLWLGRYLFKLEAVRRRLGLSSKVDKDSETLRLWRDMQVQQDLGKDQSPKETLLKLICDWIDDAGWKIPFRVVLLGVIALSILAFIFAFVLLGGFWIGICAAFSVLFIFTQYVQNRISQRANLFERQLVDSLGVAGRSLRAGHPLVGAFQLISEEISEPIGPIFQKIYRHQAFGTDLRESLSIAAQENRNREFKLFATAVTVQMQSGGNLADLMDTLSSVIRERIWLNKRIRVLTAQVQFSKVVLIAMPILVFIMLNITNKSYMKPMFEDPTGNMLMIVMFVNIILGSWLMGRLAKIDF